MCVGAAAVSWVWGLVLAGGVAWIAYRMRLLTWDGAIGAIAVGTSVFGVGGWQASGLLVFFFFSSSLLPQVLGRQRASEQRHLWQVLANGGVPTLTVWLAWLVPEWANRAWVAYTASLACATGDTWATEIGVRYGNRPRLITTGRPVPTGTSGGISMAGTLGALAGCGMLAGLGVGLLGLSWVQAGWALGSGFAGVMLDSLLGATVQARFVCSRCARPVETRQHCAVRTQFVSGWRWLDNHSVNALSTLASALSGMIGG